MHLYLERCPSARSDCPIHALSWMGKVPDDMPEEEGWKLNRVLYYQEGWLATGNARGIVGVTHTASHHKKGVDSPARTNYNLRGHRAEVTLVKWNEPYQKLATCDSSGIIFVWIKYEGRWSIELINDRNTAVTHFSWSHDGRMALICYQDGFVLVGSVAGQRYWSLMLNIQAVISAGVFAPDDQQVYFGTSSGQVLVMDVHGTMVAQVTLLDQTPVTSLAWSCPKFKMEETPDEGERSSGGDTSSGSGGDGGGASGDGDNKKGKGDTAATPPTTKKLGETKSGFLTTSSSPDDRPHLLAVVFGTGLVYLVKGHDDVTPIVLDTGLLGVHAEWTNSAELLATAGYLPPPGTDSTSTGPRQPPPFPQPPTATPGGRGGTSTSSPPTNGGNTTNTAGGTTGGSGSPSSSGGGGGGGGSGQPVYRNVIRFYTRNGTLRYTQHLPLGPHPVSALTWGHNDKRVFIATGPQLYIGRVSRRIGSLHLLCRLAVKEKIPSEALLSQLPLPRRLQTHLQPLYNHTVKCCIPTPFELRTFVTRPPSSLHRLHCTMIRHDEDLVPTPGTCYTLYLEYLGGLVPLLKGKRISKIRPEFVIFDPQVENSSLRSAGIVHQSSGGAGGGVGGASVGGGGGSGPGSLIPALSDSSDSEHEDMCASPRLQRRRKLRRRIRERLESETDDLVYLDTLPEQHRLVEVTSNIWGTKFKLHGVAASLPPNLGQVTYKTSLLHLQPRQMTLMITELRDDIPPRPDPSFNPNVFSEDEEDVDRDQGDGAQALPSDVPPIAPMTPRRTPSSYSRHDMITPSPSPWDVPSSVDAPANSSIARSDDDLLLKNNTSPTRVPVDGLPGGGAARSEEEEALLADSGECAYVDLSAPEVLQLREGLRAELMCGPSLALTATGSSGYSPAKGSYSCGSPLLSPRHSVTALSYDHHTRTNSYTSASPSKFSTINSSPRLNDNREMSSKKKTSTARPLDVEPAARLLQHSSPSRLFRRDPNKDKRKKSTSEALLQQLNTLTVAATSSPLFGGGSSLSSSSDGPATGTNSSGSNPSSGGSTHRSSPQHAPLSTGEGKAEVIRFIDEESGESDNRSFTPSPARSTPKAAHGGSSGSFAFASAFGGGGSGTTLASSIATSIANTFGGSGATSPRKRARSKSVGQLHSFEALVTGSSSFSSSTSGYSQGVLTQWGGASQHQQSQPVHSMQQLTTMEAFLAFRRSLSLKDGKKNRAPNGVTWPKLLHHGKSRSLDSSLLLLNKRNLMLHAACSTGSKAPCSNLRKGSHTTQGSHNSHTSEGCDSQLIISSCSSSSVTGGFAIEQRLHHINNTTTTTNNNQHNSANARLRITHRNESEDTSTATNTSSSSSSSNSGGSRSCSSRTVTYHQPSPPVSSHCNCVVVDVTTVTSTNINGSPCLYHRLNAEHRHCTSDSSTNNNNINNSSPSRRVFSYPRPSLVSNASSSSNGSSCTSESLSFSNPQSPVHTRHGSPNMGGHRRINSHSNFNNYPSSSVVLESGPRDGCHQRQRSLGSSCLVPNNSSPNVPRSSLWRTFSTSSAVTNNSNRSETFNKSDTKYNSSLVNSSTSCCVSDCGTNPVSTSTNSVSTSSSTYIDGHHHHHYHHHHHTHYHHPSLRVETLERQQARGLKESALAERLSALQRECSNPSSNPLRPSSPTASPPTPTHTRTMRPPYPQPPPTPRHTPHVTPESRRREMASPPTPHHHLHQQHSLLSRGSSNQLLPQSSPVHDQHQPCASSSTSAPSSSRKPHGEEYDDSIANSPSVSPSHASKSIPNTPARSRKQRRHQSSSPIRKHLLSSPLLSRRRQRRGTVESSDDEPLHCSSDAELLCPSTSYRDLETFQKTQLRNKLRRSRGRSDGILGTGSWGGGSPFGGGTSDVTAAGPPSAPPTPRHKQFTMHNKAPLWNENSQVYQLDFGGRVTQESAKNFQIEFRGKQVMQFGRIDGNAYTLDFQYPFSAVQAFAVALANVTQRLK